MNKIATIKVFYKPGKYEMVINETDFDEKIHEKIGKQPVASTQPAKPKVDKPKKANEDDEVKALIGEE